MSISIALSSFVTGGDLLSAILDCFLSPITDGGPLSTILSCFLFLIAGGGPLFTVFDYSLSFITNGDLLSTISSLLLSLVDSGSSLFAVFDGSFLSPVFFAGFWVLFLPSTLSRVYNSFLLSLSLLYSLSLFSLPIPLARNLNLFMRKRLFN